MQGHLLASLFNFLNLAQFWLQHKMGQSSQHHDAWNGNFSSK